MQPKTETTRAKIQPASDPDGETALTRASNRNVATVVAPLNLSCGKELGHLISTLKTVICVTCKTSSAITYF